MVYARFLWVYLVAPSLGGFASAMFNKYIHLPNINFVADNKEQQRIENNA